MKLLGMVFVKMFDRVLIFLAFAVGLCQCVYKIILNNTFYNDLCRGIQFRIKNCCF